jgi:hypothetical protein
MADAFDDTLQGLLAALPRWAANAMAYTALWMEQRAKATTAFNDQTGNLRNSIQAQVTEQTALVVEATLAAGAPGIGATMEYAPYVELGTPPHVIRPRDAKALYWEGADHPVPAVNHPGTPPKPFIWPTAQEAAAQRIFERAFQSHLSQGLGGNP